MASSNSQHSHTHPPAASCNSARKSTPAAGNNNPPEFQPHFSNTATSPLPKEEELNLLKDIFDFYQKTQTYPDADLDNLMKFYLHWIQRRLYQAYADEFEVGKKIDELNFRFFVYMGKKLNGEYVEGEMDLIDIQIFQLSNLIWGLKEYDYRGMEASSSKGKEVGSSSLGC